MSYCCSNCGEKEDRINQWILYFSAPNGVRFPLCDNCAYKAIDNIRAKNEVSK